MGQIDGDADLCFDARLCAALGYARKYYGKTIE